jgi:hypothetical protein
MKEVLEQVQKKYEREHGEKLSSIEELEIAEKAGHIEVYNEAEDRVVALKNGLRDFIAAKEALIKEGGINEELFNHIKKNRENEIKRVRAKMVDILYGLIGIDTDKLIDSLLIEEGEKEQAEKNPSIEDILMTEEEKKKAEPADYSAASVTGKFN